jgi:Protein of unknown function (DUF3606)
MACRVRNYASTCGPIYRLRLLEQINSRPWNLGTDVTVASHQEAAMADDKTKTAQDGRRIDVHQDYELRYWSGKFGVSEDQIKAAVQKVGTMADDVARELGKIMPGKARPD